MNQNHTENSEKRLVDNEKDIKVEHEKAKERFITDNHHQQTNKHQT
jgi:hypothetical protein